MFQDPDRPFKVVDHGRCALLDSCTGFEGGKPFALLLCLMLQCEGNSGQAAPWLGCPEERGFGHCCPASVHYGSFLVSPRLVARALPTNTEGTPTAACSTQETVSLVRLTATDRASSPTTVVKELHLEFRQSGIDAVTTARTGLIVQLVGESSLAQIRAYGGKMPRAAIVEIVCR